MILEDIEFFAHGIYNGENTNLIVSNFGYAMYPKGHRKAGEIVKTRIIQNHYFVRGHVSGKRKYFSLGKLVLETFVDIPEKYKKLGLTTRDLEADHVDANHKEDNSLTNLQWLTPRENKEKAKLNNEIPKGVNKPNTDVTIKQIKKVCKELERNRFTMKKIANLAGVSMDCVYGIRIHRTFRDISKKYSIDNYNIQPGRKWEQEKIHEVCRLLESEKYTYKEIAEMTGVSKSLVNNIYGKHRWRSISQYYDF